jgi:CRP-like cAMP-binding protein
MIATKDSSYLGDNDVLLRRSGYRTATGICAGDCQIYAIKNNQLDEVLEKNPKIKKLMIDIACEKEKYYDILREELRSKYRSKKSLEELYEKKKDYQWTFYISLKRQMVKKQNASQARLSNMMKSVKGRTPGAQPHGAATQESEGPKATGQSPCEATWPGQSGQDSFGQVHQRVEKPHHSAE